MTIVDYLREEHIWIKEPVNTPSDVFEQVFKRCKSFGYVNEEFIEKINERELLFPTGLQMDGYGVAIPHTDPECVNKQFIAVFIPEKDVVFKRMDDATADVDVNVIFVLGLNQPHSQLAILQELMVLLQEKEIIEKLETCNDEKEIVNYLINVSKQNTEMKRGK